MIKKNSITQGDSLELLKKIPDKSIDLVFADPPYNLQIGKKLNRPDNSKVNGVNDYYTHPLTRERRQIEYISGSELIDFDRYDADWQHYANQVVDKAKPVYAAMGWDLSAIRTGRIQKSLEEWF